jgi:hypothetical protein
MGATLTKTHERLRQEYAAAEHRHGARRYIHKELATVTNKLLEKSVQAQRRKAKSK